MRDEAPRPVDARRVGPAVARIGIQLRRRQVRIRSASAATASTPTATPTGGTGSARGIRPAASAATGPSGPPFQARPNGANRR